MIEMARLLSSLCPARALATAGALGFGVATGLWECDAIAQCQAERPGLPGIADRLERIEKSLSMLQRATPGVAAVPPAPSEVDGAQPPTWTRDTLEKVIFTHDQIQSRIVQLGAQVSAHYAGVEEDDFVVVGLLSGCYMFMADLTREIDVPHRVDFVAASSYGQSTVSSSNVKIKKDLNLPIENKHVLLVDEMCDSGRTLASLKQLMHDRGAKSVRTCCLLDKIERRVVDVELDFVGFNCPDEFVVGYGTSTTVRRHALTRRCMPLLRSGGPLSVTHPPLRAHRASLETVSDAFPPPFTFPPQPPPPVSHRRYGLGKSLPQYSARLCRQEERLQLRPLPVHCCS